MPGLIRLRELVLPISTALLLGVGLTIGVHTFLGGNVSSVPTRDGAGSPWQPVAAAPSKPTPAAPAPARSRAAPSARSDTLAARRRKALAKRHRRAASKPASAAPVVVPRPSLNQAQTYRTSAPAAQPQSAPVTTHTAPPAPRVVPRPAPTLAPPTAKPRTGVSFDDSG